LPLLARPRLLLEGLQRRDADDVPDLLLPQTLAGQDDVQRLVPGDVPEANGDLPGHVIGDDDVLLADLGDDPQEVVDVDVLELERRPSSPRSGSGR
jgi:hypothetical protein